MNKLGFDVYNWQLWTSPECSTPECSQWKVKFLLTHCFGPCSSNMNVSMFQKAIYVLYNTMTIKIKITVIFNYFLGQPQHPSHLMDRYVIFYINLHLLCLFFRLCMCCSNFYCAVMWNVINDTGQECDKALTDNHLRRSAYCCYFYKSVIKHNFKIFILTSSVQ